MAEMDRQLARAAEDVMAEGRDRELRRHRRRIATIAVPGLIGVLATIVVTNPPGVLFEWVALGLHYFIPQLIVLSSLAMCGFGLVMWYLDTGFKGPRTSSADPEQRATNIDAKEFEHFKRDVIERIESLEDKEPASEGISREVNEELVRRVGERIAEEATDQYLEEIRAGVRTEEGRMRQADAVGRLERTISRLDQQGDALTRRGNFNLTVGSIVGAIGMGVLGYFVVEMTDGVRPGAQEWEFVLRFLPQLSLVTIVEVFAYFFLRLYSRSLTELKYFQNEISNFEAKLASLETAFEIDDNDLIRRVVLELAATERNHILRKGETTVAAEQWKADGEARSSFARTVSGALKSDRTKEG